MKKLYKTLCKIPLLLLVFTSFCASIYASYTHYQGITYDFWVVSIR